VVEEANRENEERQSRGDGARQAPLVARVPGGHAAGAVAAVLAALVIGGLAWWWPPGCAKGRAGPFRQGINPTVTISTTLTEVKTTPKLVVSTATVSVNVTVRNQWSWLGIELPGTVIHLSAPDNKVQYYIPMGELSKQDFRYERDRETFVVTLPEVRPDAATVGMDPKKWEVLSKGTWITVTRIVDDAVAELMKSARTAVRPAALKQARVKFRMEDATREADAVLRRLFSPLTNTLRPGVRLEFEFGPGDATPAKGGEH